MLLGLCQDRKQVCIVQEEETGEIQPESVTPGPMVKLKILVTANARRSMSFPQGHQSNADYMADMIKHAHTPLRFEVILESLLDLLDSHVGLRRRHWTERSWQDNFHLKMLKRWKSVAVLIDEIRRTYILGSCLCHVFHDVLNLRDGNAIPEWQFHAVF